MTAERKNVGAASLSACRGEGYALDWRGVVHSFTNLARGVDLYVLLTRQFGRFGSQPRGHARLALSTLSLLLFLFVFFPTISIAGEAITIVNNQHQNSYPASVKFLLEAQSSSPITKIVLRHKLGHSQATSVSNVSFQPGLKVKAEHVWNTQRQYVPPGTEIEYFWQIEDSAGNRAETVWTTLAVLDTRFDWQRLESGNVSLHWYRGDWRFAQDLLEAATRAARRLSEEVGAQLERPAKLFVYEKHRDMFGALPPRNVEWTGAQAFSEAGIIVIQIEPTVQGRSFGQRAVPHEISHLIVHAATDNPFGGLPHWLDEGLAVYAEGDLDGGMVAALNDAVTNDTLLSLQSIAGNFPTNEDLARLAYAQGYSVVKYLLGTYGRDKMTRLLGVFKEGSTADRTFRSAYGFDVAALEREWRLSMGAKGSTSIPSEIPTASGSATQLYPSDTAPLTRLAADVSLDRLWFGGLFIGVSLGAFWVLVRLSRRRTARPVSDNDITNRP